MTVPEFAHSNFARKAEDDYFTIDGRLIDALLATWPIKGSIVDCCAARGSGIITRLHELGWPDLVAASDPWFKYPAEFDWIVTNPPHDRKVVDSLMDEITARVRRSAKPGRSPIAAAVLQREGWDLAQCREALFASPLYRGQTRMRFRPWWSEDRRAQPIHSYVWHVWAVGSGEPVVRYWSPP